MKIKSFSVLLLSLICSVLISNTSFSQAMSIDAWPTDTDFSKEIHF